MKKVRELFLLKTKFATTSLIATSVEYALYAIFTGMGLEIRPAHICSFVIGVMVNFLLQKRYVFQLKRRLNVAFLGAMAVSLGGIFLNLAIWSLLVRFPFFEHNHYFAKLGATGMLFFYNFYMKRFVFEKKFI